MNAPIMDCAKALCEPYRRENHPDEYFVADELKAAQSSLDVATGRGAGAARDADAADFYKKRIKECRSKHYPDPGGLKDLAHSLKEGIGHLIPFSPKKYMTQIDIYRQVLNRNYALYRCLGHVALDEEAAEQLIEHRDTTSLVRGGESREKIENRFYENCIPQLRNQEIACLAAWGEAFPGTTNCLLTPENILEEIGFYENLRQGIGREMDSWETKNPSASDIETDAHRRKLLRDLYFSELLPLWIMKGAKPVFGIGLWENDVLIRDAIDRMAESFVRWGYDKTAVDDYKREAYATTQAWINSRDMFYKGHGDSLPTLRYKLERMPMSELHQELIDDASHAPLFDYAKAKASVIWNVLMCAILGPGAYKSNAKRIGTRAYRKYSARNDGDLARNDIGLGCGSGSVCVIRRYKHTLFDDTGKLVRGRQGGALISECVLSIDLGTEDVPQLSTRVVLGGSKADYCRDTHRDYDTTCDYLSTRLPGQKVGDSYDSASHLLIELVDGKLLAKDDESGIGTYILRSDGEKTKLFIIRSKKIADADKDALEKYFKEYDHPASRRDAFEANEVETAIQLCRGDRIVLGEPDVEYILM